VKITGFVLIAAGVAIVELGAQQARRTHAAEADEADADEAEHPARTGVA
jgi:hypothetical protein